MSKELNKGLKLKGEEKILCHIQNIGHNPIWKYLFPSLYSAFPTIFFFIGLIMLYIEKSLTIFGVMLFFTILFSFLGILLYDLVLSESNADLFVTSIRVVFVHSKGLSIFKRKNKEINLQDISYIQIWTDKFEIAKKRDDGIDKYTGSEVKFRLWYFKRYFSIHFEITNDPSSEILTQKIINAISENVSFVKHLYLEGILLFNTLKIQS